MTLFRVFEWDGRSRGAKPGGPLYVPRWRQGKSRHGIPDQDGVLYASLSAVSAVAETLQAFRNQTAPSGVFEVPGDRRRALATFRLDGEGDLLDLRDARVLVRHHIRPPDVSTFHRSVTQALSRALFETGVPGFLWWSALESTWTNVTLFQSKVKTRLKLQNVHELTVQSSEVTDAARSLLIQFD